MHIKANFLKGLKLGRPLPEAAFAGMPFSGDPWTLVAKGLAEVTMARFRPNLVLDGLDAHGEDALDEITFSTAEGIVHTAQLCDDLLMRGSGGLRPPGLDDDMAWIRAASGRGYHSDSRLPLIG